MKFLLAKKLNMTQIFDENGKVIPVTVLETGSVKVTQIKTKEKDGYNAIQIGFGTKKNITKPLRGHLKDLGNFRWLKEFKVNDETELEKYKLGDEIKVDILQEGETVNIRGISRGKGFQGVMKRHGFHGKEATHGVKHAHREPGSIGATTPQRVIKGKKMAGRTGGKTITLKKVKIVKIEPQNNLLYIKGAIPGKRGTLIEIWN